MPYQKRKIVKCTENTNPDVSIVAGEGDSKASKKETWIKDFDIQARDHIAEMETQMSSVLADLNRMGATARINLNKKIRQMTVKEFVAQGGNLVTLDLPETSDCMSSDISFINQKSPLAENETLKNTTKPAAKESKRNKRIREAPNQEPTNNRTRSGRKVNESKKAGTPVPKKISRKIRGDEVIPKFDISKPLKFARNPKDGETLLSLAGSPVVTNRVSSNHSDTSNLVSISLNSQQAILSGSLFDMNTMSPGTLLRNKEVMEEVMGVVNSRLEDLNKQLGDYSKSNSS